MNEEARAELDRILALEPEAQTEADKAFLQARRSYLTEEQRIRNGITEPAVEPEVSEAPTSRRRAK